jgi:hypothetical protein
VKFSDLKEINVRVKTYDHDVHHLSVKFLHLSFYFYEIFYLWIKKISFVIIFKLNIKIRLVRFGCFLGYRVLVYVIFLIFPSLYVLQVVKILQNIVVQAKEKFKTVQIIVELNLSVIP